MGQLIEHQLADVLDQVGAGRVVSYSWVGRRLEPPMTGRQVGRLMAETEADVPWWRVVAKSGLVVSGKRDPRLGFEQRDRLEEEGVLFRGDRIAWECFLDAEDE